MSSDPPTVLVVDDEENLVDLYREYLREGYDVRTAIGGEPALERLDSDVDAILLDRRMPGLSGDELLTKFRDRGYDCPVAMVTAVEPDADIVELGFDEYIVKPVSREKLRATVASLLQPPPEELDDPFLEALGDPKTRRCCVALTGASLSAQELADVTGFSLATVYRRLNALQQAGLIESERTVDPSGDHYQTFTTIPTRIQIELGDEIQVTVEHPDQTKA